MKTLSEACIKQKIKQESLPYFEPIIMDLFDGGKHSHWVHPLIEDICKFGGKFDDGEDNPYEDGHSFRVEIKFKDGSRLSMAVKSSLLQEYWTKVSEHFDDLEGNKMTWDEITKGITVTVPADMKSTRQGNIEEELPMYVEVILMEDVWNPSGSEQFCLTEFGELVGEKFGQEWEYTHSPDIAVHKHGSEYGWDT